MVAEVGTTFDGCCRESTRIEKMVGAARRADPSFRRECAVSPKPIPHAMTQSRKEGRTAVSAVLKNKDSHGGTEPRRKSIVATEVLCRLGANRRNDRTFSHPSRGHRHLRPPAISYSNQNPTANVAWRISVKYCRRLTISSEMPLPVPNAQPWTESRPKNFDDPVL